MKTNRTGFYRIIPLLISLVLFCAVNVKAQSLIPPGSPYFLLDSWSFNDTTWQSDFGDIPLDYTNLNNPPGFDGNALQVDTNVPAFLQYNIVDDVATNLTFDEGTIELWVLPDWSSGTGPGDWGRLIDTGAYDTNSPSSWWSLYFSPDGTSINFSSETNGVFTNYLTVPISWDTNTWHMIDLIYWPTKTELYIDGVKATNGGGMSYNPSADVISNGFFVGSDMTGWQQSRSLIDDLATFNYALGLDEITNDYGMGLQIINGGGLSPGHGGFGDVDPTPPGGGTNSVNPAFSSPTPEDFGTNLWIAQESVISNTFAGILSNTIPDIEYQLLSMPSLECTQWTSQGFVYGSETNNWTPWSLPYSPTNSFFLTALSWQDDSGTGIPDWWWLQNLGQYTNVDANAPDPAGDGWSYWQKYAMGISPSVWTTPPPPPGASILYNNINQTVTLTWQPSQGNVTGYTITRIAGFDYYNQWTTNATTFVDTSPITNFAPEVEGPPYYLLQANYTNGSSESEYLSMFNPNTTVSGQLLTANDGGANLTLTSPLPPGTTALQLLRIDYDYGIFGGYTESTFDIPVSYMSGNTLFLPETYFTNYDDGDYVDEDWYVQTVNTNGSVSTPAQASTDIAPLFFDGRQQLSQNLSFMMRAANPSAPLYYAFVDSPYNSYGYAFSGLYGEMPITSSESPAPYLDKFRPFEENYFFHNFAYSTNDVDTNGFLTTGLTLNNYNIPVLVPPFTYTFQPETTNDVIPAILDPENTPLITFFPQAENETVFLGGGYPNAPAQLLDLTGSGGAWAFSSPITNLYGLPLTSVLFAYNQNGIYETSLLSLGDSNTNVNNGGLYWQVTPPELQTTNYYFAQPSAELLPGDPNFSITNITSTGLIAGYGQTSIFAGYAEQVLLNGIANTNAPYAYLGQYFEPEAYQVDTNGNITTNSAGVVSPYGEFVPTAVGPAALVTMTNWGENVHGTCEVQVVKLVLDVNHDGVMDLSSTGADNTTASTPYVFWANNNADRWDFDYPFGDAEQDDQEVGFPDCPSLAHTPTGDCNYTDANCNRAIPCTRDLEDFARLWVCGINSNLLAALPSGCTISLNWGDVGSPNPNNPTIDLFPAADPEGGIGYQTNEDIATAQTENLYYPCIGRIGPGSNLVLNASTFANNWAGNYYIWCGVSNGTGGLTLTIANSNGVTLAQTTTYIQIEDIKQMYERWTVGDNPSIQPATNAIPVTEGLPPGMPAFTYPPPTTTNTPYILWLHGYNMAPWEKDAFGATSYKRLYWQGYQGRFGSFGWPTSEHAVEFGASEIQSWDSAQGLLNKLIDLNNKYPGQVYLLAHSLGNVAAGEALRLAGTNQLVNTYIAMQGAVTANAYDSTVPTHTLWNDSGTPDCYAYYWTNGSPCYFNFSQGAGTYVNFFNPNDWALSFWLNFENLKPTLSSGYNFVAPSYYFKDDYETELFFPTNTYELFDKLIQARSYALGAQTNVGGVFKAGIIYHQIALPSVWPPDTGQYSAHIWHSAEYRSDNPAMWQFWNQVLVQAKLNP